MEDGIDKLEGNHLSAAVAREVMGESPPDYATDSGDGSYYLDTDYSQFPWKSYYWPNEYATDVRSAFAVIENRIAAGLSPNLNTNGPGGRWRCSFMEPGELWHDVRSGASGGPPSWVGFGKTPAEAICRAAIRSARAKKANASEVTP